MTVDGRQDQIKAHPDPGDAAQDRQRRRGLGDLHRVNRVQTGLRASGGIALAFGGVFVAQRQHPESGSDADEGQTGAPRHDAPGSTVDAR